MGAILLNTVGIGIVCLEEHRLFLSLVLRVFEQAAGERAEPAVEEGAEPVVEEGAEPAEELLELVAEVGAGAGARERCPRRGSEAARLVRA